MKPLSKVCVFAMLALIAPAELWAQQNLAPAQTQEPTNPNVATADGGLLGAQFLAPLPNLGDPVLWYQVGVSALVDKATELPPGYGGNDHAFNQSIIHDVFAGVKSQNSPLKDSDVVTVYNRVWSGALEVGGMSNFTEVPQWFRDDILDKMAKKKWYRKTITEGFQFQGKMAWSKAPVKGVPGPRILEITGPAIAKFKNPEEMYVLEPTLLKEGEYAGRRVSFVVPVGCLNFTLILAEYVDSSTTAPAPRPIAKAAPKTAKVRVIKFWRESNGKRDDVPTLQEAQLVMEAVPEGPGPTITLTSYDNKEVVFDLEVGKRYTIREALNTFNWRIQGRDSYDITVGEKNEDLPFTNVRSVVPQVPASLDTAEGGGHKLRNGLIAAGVVAGVVVGAILIAKALKPRVTINMPGGKASSPGGTAGGTAGASVNSLRQVSFSFSF
jgi:hypothetical protein